MGFPKEIYAQAMELKRRQREVAEERAEAVREKLYKNNPSLCELDRALSASGALAASLAVSGDTERLKEVTERAAVLAEKKKAITDKCRGLIPEYCCKKCSDTGRVDGKYCECVEAIARELAYGRLCADMPLDESGFDSFRLDYYSSAKGKDGISPHGRMKEIFELCRSYAAEFSMSSGNLLFLGGTGLGKTHLSLGIVREVLKKGYGVIYGPAQNLISAAEKEKFSGEGAGTLDSLLDCDLLVIDDLGAEFATPFSIALIYNIINTRLQRRLPTVISTNLGLKEIETRYSARVSSRLIGNYTMRQFLGADVRQLKALGR